MKKYFIISVLTLFLFSSCATRVVTPAPTTKVVVVKHPPKHHKVVVIKGKKYYYWNGQYHRKTRKGFVIVKI